jgi:uncharacterized protein YndB with AHSA1/START domain
MDPRLDLDIERVIKAPRQTVWEAWTTPRRLEKWWLPAPAACRVDRLELHSGGAFVTSMADPGDAMRPHLDGCFLEVQEQRRIVFTTAIDSTWRPAPADRLRMTATITLDEAPGGGTLYRGVIRHADAADRVRHQELGFEHGWSTVIAQLAALLEGEK